jgi:hypothetical protein
MLFRNESVYLHNSTTSAVRAHPALETCLLRSIFQPFASIYVAVTHR